MIHYRLEKEYEFFEAWVGVDLSRGTLGSVNFIVSRKPIEIRGVTFTSGLWELVVRDFPDAKSRRQIRWEQDDRIWDKDWSDLAELGQRYASATREALRDRAGSLAKQVNSPQSLHAVREVYYLSREIEEAMAELKKLNFRSLRLAIADLADTFCSQYPKGGDYLRRLDELEKTTTELLANEDREPMVNACWPLVGASPPSPKKHCCRTRF